MGNVPVLVVCVNLRHRAAAMQVESEGAPYVSGGPLAVSLREWVGALWP